MIPLFMDEADRVLRRARRMKPRTLTVVTGHSPYRYLADFLARLSARTGITFQPVAIPNRLFGESVTVTGLVAGRDILSELAGRNLGDGVLIPDVMLKEGEGVFLDDLTIGALEQGLGVPVVVVPSSPAGVMEGIRALRP